MAQTHYHILDAYEEEVGTFPYKREAEEALGIIDEEGNPAYSWPLTIKGCRRNCLKGEI